MKAVVVRLTVIGMVLVSNPVSAILGEGPGSAKVRSSQWNKQYGVVAPIIRTSTRGVVIFECWSAPPSGLSEAKALRFAQDLLPESVSGGTPNKIKVDGQMHIFQVTGGYTIILHEFKRSLGDGPVTDIEVHDSSWKGSHC